MTSLPSPALTAFVLHSFGELTPAGKIFQSVVMVGALILASVILRNIWILRKSPRELWIMYGFKLTEYSAFGAITVMIVQWLSADCGLSDRMAGDYKGIYYGILASIVGIAAGPLVDTIGIKRICIISVILLIISRIGMSFVTDPWIVYFVGFLPMALGFGLVAPVISVGIKRYTTKDTVAVGFGFFYILMNCSYAIGGSMLDIIKESFKGGLHLSVSQDLTLHFSKYQCVFLYGVALTVLSALIVLLLRDGVEQTENGTVIHPPAKTTGSIPAEMWKSLAKTAKLMSSVASEKFFWIYMIMIGLTVFVRSVFIHFHDTFPKYGERVFGEDAKIGNLYMVLNPVLVLFLVPLIAMMTRKVSSFRMFAVGATISAVSCFLTALPGEWFRPLTHSMLGEMVFIHWLGLADNMDGLMAAQPTPYYWVFLLFVSVFTLGEAIWSPRLMQYSVEIAPKGRESTYLALSLLPFLFAKIVATPLSGRLLAAYTPVDANGNVLPHPDHVMIWIWIGAIAMITPIGLLFIRKLMHQHSEEPSGGQ
jgi:proton-dependent oligopeptide transporter, POT family